MQSWRGFSFGMLAAVLAACGEAPPSADDEADSESDESSESSGSESNETGDDMGESSDDATTTDDESTDTGNESTDESETGPEPPDPRLEALLTYAPRVWFDVDEEYFPSSVEWAFPDLVRTLEGDGNWWLRTIEPLDSPSDTLPFFAGDLATAPVYAYWADKGGGVIDLVYFFYYPYNRGKEVVDTIWGNHVGDWEHITVRVLQQADAALVPEQVYLSAHSFGGAYAWADVEKFEGTHPVTYAAWGSHGMWKDPGDHVYMSIGVTDPIFDTCISIVCADLTDETSQGTVWDTWLRLEGFDFFAQEGLGDSEWPVWMSDQFGEPGSGDPAVAGMGPIFRWGNPEDCSTLGVDISDLIGVCRLEDGPTGPISKSTWGPNLE
jgi:hypothetical protein